MAFLARDPHKLHAWAGMMSLTGMLHMNESMCELYPSTAWYATIHLVVA